MSALNKNPNNVVDNLIADYTKSIQNIEKNTPKPQEVNGAYIIPIQEVDDDNDELFLDLPDVYSHADREDLKRYARSLQLNSDQALGFTSIAKKIHERAILEHLQKVSAWESSLRIDKEFGGDKFEKNVAYAQVALNHYDDTGEMREILSTTGFGSHPCIVKFFAMLGKSLKEDSVYQQGSVMDSVPLHQRLYGKN